MVDSMKHQKDSMKSPKVQVAFQWYKDQACSCSTSWDILGWKKVLCFARAILVRIKPSYISWNVAGLTSKGIYSMDTLGINYINNGKSFTVLPLPLPKKYHNVVAEQYNVHVLRSSRSSSM